MTQKKGRFIVVEGIDGSGKSLQLELLKNHLKKQKVKFKVVDFPRYYTSVWGNLLGELLSGKHGDFLKTTPYLTILPYMIDEYVWGKDVGEKLLNKGYWIISNRYFTSNVHQVAKLNGVAKAKYREWSWAAGYKVLKILRPDLVIFLDLNAKTARKLNKKKEARAYLHGKKQDLAEKNFDHQIRTYKEYLRTVSRFKYWTKVACEPDGRLDSPDIIHERVWEKVETLI